MGTSVIIYKEVFIKFFLMERVAGQSHHLREGGFRQTVLCPWAGGKEGCQHQPRGANGEQRLQGFTLVVFSIEHNTV